VISRNTVGNWAIASQITTAIAACSQLNAQQCRRPPFLMQSKGVASTAFRPQFEPVDIAVPCIARFLVVSAAVAVAVLTVNDK